MNDPSSTKRGAHAAHREQSPAERRPGDRGFDLIARRHYGEALEAIPPRTLARLRAARHATAERASPARGIGWMLAGGCAAVFAMAIALQLQLNPTPAPAQTAAANATIDAAELRSDEAGSAIAALDENPDLYLWLASNDDALPPPAGQWP